MRYVLLIAAVLLALAPTSALAFQPVAGLDVVIDPNLTINDDLYIASRSVDVRGTVNGDVVAFARTIIISGVVTGDVIALGGSISVPGQVGGSIRATGSYMTIDGSSGEDVVFSGGTLGLAPNGVIGRDLVMVGNSITVEGTVGGKVLIGAMNVDVRGKVGEDDSEPSTSLSSDENAADSLKTVPLQAFYNRAYAALPLDRVVGAIEDWLQALAGLLILGAGFVIVFPQVSRRIPSTIENAPWASLGLGLASAILIPTIALVLFVAGLFVGIWWLGLVLLAIFCITLPLSFALASLTVGNLVLERTGRTGVNMLWAMLAGLSITLLLSQVPYLGGIVILSASLFGLGALILTVYRTSQVPDTAQPSS